MNSVLQIPIKDVLNDVFGIKTNIDYGKLTLTNNKSSIIKEILDEDDLFYAYILSKSKHQLDVTIYPNDELSKKGNFLHELNEKVFSIMSENFYVVDPILTWFSLSAQVYGQSIHFELEIKLPNKVDSGVLKNKVNAGFHMIYTDEVDADFIITRFNSTITSLNRMYQFEDVNDMLYDYITDIQIVSHYTNISPMSIDVNMNELKSLESIDFNNMNLLDQVQAIAPTGTKVKQVNTYKYSIMFNDDFEIFVTDVDGKLNVYSMASDNEYNMFDIIDTNTNSLTEVKPVIDKLYEAFRIHEDAKAKVDAILASLS